MKRINGVKKYWKRVERQKIECTERRCLNKEVGYASATERFVKEHGIGNKDRLIDKKKQKSQDMPHDKLQKNLATYLSATARALSRAAV